MKPEEQRIAIHKARGFTLAQTKGFVMDIWTKENPYVDTGPAPDYLNDISAIAEARAFLSENQACDFVRKLAHVIGADGWTESTHDVFQLINATPAQQAEAFLKTLNLWKQP